MRSKSRLECASTVPHVTPMTRDQVNFTDAIDRDGRVHESHEQKVRHHDRLLRELFKLDVREEQQLAEEGLIGLADDENSDFSEGSDHLIDGLTELITN